MKSPAFSLYVRDVLCSQLCSKLHSKSSSKDSSNLLSRGFSAYWYLLCNAWLQEPRATLPDSDFELADLARVSMEEWMAIKSVIMPEFQQLPSGRWFHPRQMEESKIQEIRSKSGSKGGRKTQAKRVAALEDADADGNGTSLERGRGGEPDIPHDQLFDRVGHLKRNLCRWFVLPDDRAWPNEEERLMPGIVSRRTFEADLIALNHYHARANGYFPKSTRSLIEKWDHHVQVASKPIPSDIKPQLQPDHSKGF
jgi:uncharacterized protein YdaU (DUF1376 family)